jgi:Cu/Ag efflux protein CusF
MKLQTITKSIFLSLAMALGAGSFSVPALADSHMMSDGVIRKIDMKQGKVTIKHGEIPNLDMPPMSMVFTVEDHAMLESLAKGDTVRFVAEDKGGKLYVTEIQLAK